MYYLTSLAAWQRHAHRFSGSHWITLDTAAPGEGNSLCSAGVSPASLRADAAPSNLESGFLAPPNAPGEGNSPIANSDAIPTDSRTLPTGSNSMPDEPISLDAATPILVLVEGDEGAHLVLESDADFTPLPHPLAQKAIPAAVQSAIAARGIAIPDRATTFEAAESLARVHPLLRHRVF
ncbi:MAG TPA: hypothetical protein VJR23_12565 [Candidatus Acidoferrales bacterium]|nr:hypothetical protein [Candidatus Acidoferrales bacterium]